MSVKKRNASSRNSNSSPPAQAAFKLKPAAVYLGGLSKPTMYRLIQRGLLKPNRATRHLLFTKAELDRFLSQ
jgi:excisionase family DNA binding protein